MKYQSVHLVSSLGNGVSTLPAVEVYYKLGVMTPQLADGIKRLVRTAGARSFGQIDAADSPERRLDPLGSSPLQPEMFSFKFFEPSAYDELTCDIIVRIHLRNQRYVRNINGNEARKDARRFAKAISTLNTSAKFHVGFEIVMHESFWGSFDAEHH